MRSSSVMALLIFGTTVELAVFVLDLVVDISFLDEFLAFTGIFPDIYRAARPAPAFKGGNRRAMMEVDLGMIVVSSSYSMTLLATGRIK
jgi:hypothetical protein